MRYVQYGSLVLDLKVLGLKEHVAVDICSVPICSSPIPIKLGPSELIHTKGLRKSF